VDEVVRIAGECGMILCLGVFHQLQKKVITRANARSYAKWIAQRYRQFPHIVWSMYPEAKAEYVPVLQQLAAGLMEGDSRSHLISVHPDPSPTSSSFIHNEPWLDFNTIQTCITYDLVHKMVIADYKLTPVKPVVMAEGGYEGKQYDRVHPPLAIRKQAWWTYLSGGYYSYGHNSNWERPEPWAEWINTPGAQQMGVCKKIVTSLPGWWNIIPDQSIITDGQGSGYTLNTAGRSPAGDWVLVYISSATPVTVRMDCITGSTQVTAAWIDPTAGEKTEIKKFPGHSNQTFSLPPGREDAVLLLSK
jgi:hypothetical protein